MSCELSNMNQFLQSDLATNHLAMIYDIAYFILTTHILFKKGSKDVQELSNVSRLNPQNN